MGNGHYILDHMGIPVEEPDLMTWAIWFEKNRDKRIIARSYVGPCLVSTVFLGLDHGWSNRVPILFETMVFDKPRLDKETSDLDCRRYATRSEALIGHNKIVKQLEKLIAKTDRSMKKVEQGNT
jgi:hypothetical protein